MLIRGTRLKVSRRSAFLGLFGIAYGLLGYSYLHIPALFKPILHAQFRFALDLAPIEFYGWAWITTGVLCVIGALCRKLDGVGFAAGVFMPLAWSLFSFIAQIEDGIPRAWVGGTTYAALGCAVWIVSGMGDPFGKPIWRHRDKDLK